MATRLRPECWRSCSRGWRDRSRSASSRFARCRRGRCRPPPSPPPRLEHLAGSAVDESEKHKPRILRDLGQDALQIRLGTHHRPEMLDRLDAVILRERGLGEHLQRLAGRVREKVEMEPHGHRPTLWKSRVSGKPDIGEKRPDHFRSRPARIINILAHNRMESCTACGSRGSPIRPANHALSTWSQAVGRVG